MYHYNEVPPENNSNQPGSYPPPPYTYPSTDSYQNYRGYYPPQPRVSGQGTGLWRAIGWILLIWFVGAVLIGHHGFLWILILLGLIFFFTRRNRFGGWRRHWHYYGNLHYYPHTRPQAPNQYYYPPAEQPGYYSYPPQPAQPTNGSSGWPTPGDPQPKQ